MKRSIRILGRQLPLALKSKTNLQPPPELREQLVRVMADLLLEAIGEEASVENNAQGGLDEPKDHI